MLLSRANQAPEVDDAAVDDHVALAEVRPVLMAEPVQQLGADLAIGIGARAGGRARDDASSLQVSVRISNRDPKKPPSDIISRWDVTPRPVCLFRACNDWASNRL